MSLIISKFFLSIVQEYSKEIKSSGAMKSKTEKSTIKNNSILDSRLTELNASINSILGKGLSLSTYKMSEEEVKLATKEIQSQSTFSFEVGTEITYKIDKAIEISEGESVYIHTELDQTYIEDREGNSISMENPIVIVSATGDFNKSQIIFSPAKIIYTSTEGERKSIDLSADTTILEYTEPDTEYVMSGVPAHYINQKVKQLPTTVMLSTIQGVIDSMTEPEDGMAGALAGMESLAGSDESTVSDSFTDGVASGASSGVKEILDVYKSKSDAKQDMLIIYGETYLKSIFIKTHTINPEVE